MISKTYKITRKKDNKYINMFEKQLAEKHIREYMRASQQGGQLGFHPGMLSQMSAQTL
jgi:hypothetical protein